MTILIVVALETELAPQPLHNSCVIHYTGIGKVNAAIETLKAIYHYQPELIINYGTAGGINLHLSGLLEISSVLQHDYLIGMPQPRGYNIHNELCCHRPQGNREGYRCASGDQLITKADPWFQEQEVDVVDMELYAIASCCEKCQKPWRAFKFISDYANEETPKDFSENQGKGSSLFWNEMTKIIKEMK